jgi:hypothetical protein
LCHVWQQPQLFLHTHSNHAMSFFSFLYFSHSATYCSILASLSWLSV